MALSSRIPDPHTHFKKDMFVLNFLTPKTLLRFSFRALLHFYLIDIDQGIHKEKFKIAGNEKQKKLRGFSFSKRKPLFFEVFYPRSAAMLWALILKYDFIISALTLKFHSNLVQPTFFCILQICICLINCISWLDMNRF